MAPSSNVNVTLTPGFASSSYTEYWKIWIDYNADGDFSDAGEEVFSNTSSSTVNGSFTVASSANGSTRMRISMKYDGAPDPCESFTYGEVEDYTVNFSGQNDTQAPTAPTNLSYSNVTTTSVDLSWNASTDNVGVTGYIVYNNGSSIGTVTGTSANVTGLSANTTYQFYVK